MTDLKMGLALLVDKAIARKAEEKQHRDYMGASGIGTECSRQLWYSYHAPKQITDPRVNRIFDLGNSVEELVIGWLREAGLTVYEVDDNGDQFGFTDGPIAGHIDGVVIGLPESTKPHLLEVKSANAKRFKSFQDKGYKTDPKYWVQIQTYMLKMNLENGLVVVMNKDNCDLYFERVKLDKRFAERKLSRAKEIAALVDDPPIRQYSSKDYYKCKWCDHREECWS